MTFDKTKNKQTGGEGEEIAARYLETRGYKVIDRNVEFPFGEIDILAQIGKTVVIVEVKTVRGTGWGSAQELVRFKKQKKLRLLARAIEQKYPGCTVRIDVIGVEFGWDGRWEIDHLVSAVEG